jgi:hypothetical protein
MKNIRINELKTVFGGEHIGEIADTHQKHMVKMIKQASKKLEEQETNHSETKVELNLKNVLYFFKFEK